MIHTTTTSHILRNNEEVKKRDDHLLPRKQIGTTLEDVFKKEVVPAETVYSSFRTFSDSLPTLTNEYCVYAHYT